MTHANTRLTSVFILLFATTVVLAAQDKTPLQGEATDSDGHLEWISQATRQSERWKIENWVYNRSSSDPVRTIWEPLNVVTWVKPSNRSGSQVDVGTVEPQEQKGSILYGYKGNKPAPYYVKGEAAGRQNHEAICEVRLSVRLSEESLEDIFLRMVSAVTQEHDRFEVKYTITLEQKQLGELIRIEWTPAMSPALFSLLLDRYKEGLMRFDSTGTAEYAVPSDREPVLKNGRVRVLDREGTELGAAYAPAYAPPCEN
jgi:hypothetical protein